MYGRRARQRIEATAMSLAFKTEMLRIEEQKTFQLLSQMMPPSVVTKLRMGETVYPEYFECATVL